MSDLIDENLQAKEILLHKIVEVQEEIENKPNKDFKEIKDLIKEKIVLKEQFNSISTKDEQIS